MATSELKVATFMVHPLKGKESTPHAGGAIIKPTGNLLSLIERVYDNADQECNIDIAFNKSPKGKQQNDFRDLLTKYLKRPILANGQLIASRLEAVTTGRSGLGLLFLISGTNGNTHKIVISRFPADSGILAEQTQQKLSVKFLERVFMKSAYTYKSALYAHSSFDGGFWYGKAIDKQVRSKGSDITDYWINEFLASDFRTTGAHGTRRLAEAIRKAVRTTDDLDTKRELAAAATLANSLAGQRISGHEFSEKFGLSDATKKELTEAFTKPTLINDTFKFNKTEFDSQIKLRTLELNTGVLMTADAEDFNDLVSVEELGDEQVIVSTKGVISNEKLTKSR